MCDLSKRFTVRRSHGDRSHRRGFQSVQPLELQRGEQHLRDEAPTRTSPSATSRDASRMDCSNRRCRPVRFNSRCDSPSESGAHHDHDDHDERWRPCAHAPAPSSRRDCPNTSSGFTGTPIGWPSISATGSGCSCATLSSIHRFTRERLGAIDPDRFELADLPRLPTMTKSEMMAAFDDVVTDRRLSLASVEAHLAESSSEPSLLLDEYVCLASGGSSGRRGVFVQRLDEFADFAASIVRPAMARQIAGRIAERRHGDRGRHGCLARALERLRRCHPVRTGAVRLDAGHAADRRRGRSSQRPAAAGAHGVSDEAGAACARAARPPARDRAAVGDGDERAAHRRGPRDDHCRIWCAGRQSIRVDRGAGRPQRSGRIGADLRNRHVHRRARRRGEPAPCRRCRVDQNPRDQSPQPDAAAHPLRADRSFRPLSLLFPGAGTCERRSRDARTTCFGTARSRSIHW